MQFTLEKSPHIASRHSTLRMMCELACGILAIFIASEIFYYVSPLYGARYGNSGLIALAICVSVSVACDAIWALPCLWDKKVKETPLRLKNWCFQIVHSYGWITGLILTLLMPALPLDGSITPKYIYGMAISAIVGTFLAKDIFGGFGHNIFNPAVVGRVFYQFCFQSWISSSYVSWMKENSPDLYAINSGASEMSYTQSLGWTTLNNNTSVYKLLFSNALDGTIGEALAIVVIVVGIYLAVRQVIDWRTPAFYIGTIFLGTFVMALASGFGVHSFEFAFRQILMGGVLIGGFLCLTDPVTNPTSRTGRVMSATICAFITMLVRYQAAASEGVALAILTQNMISPLIEKLLVGKQTEHMKRNSILISAVVVVAMVFGGVFGGYHRTSDDLSGNPSYVTEINSLLDSQGIASTIDQNALVVEDKSDAPVKFSAKMNAGSYSMKITGFEVNGEASAYYDVTTTPINAENKKTDEESLKKDNMHVEYALIVNGKGIIGAEVLSYNDLQTVDPEVVKKCASLITVENPYTLTSSFKSLSSEYPSAGATITAGLSDLCFKAVINDFNGGK